MFSRREDRGSDLKNCFPWYHCYHAKKTGDTRMRPTDSMSIEQLEKWLGQDGNCLARACYVHERHSAFNDTETFMKSLSDFSIGPFCDADIVCEKVLRGYLKESMNHQGMPYFPGMLEDIFIVVDEHVMKDGIPVYHALHNEDIRFEECVRLRTFSRKGLIGMESPSEASSCQPEDFLLWDNSNGGKLQDHFSSFLRHRSDRLVAGFMTLCFNRNGTPNIKVEPHTLGNTTLFRGVSGSGKTTAIKSTIKGQRFSNCNRALSYFGNRPTEFNPDSSRHSRIYWLDNRMEMTSVDCMFLEEYPSNYCFIDETGNEKVIRDELSGMILDFGDDNEDLKEIFCIAKIIGGSLQDFKDNLRSSGKVGAVEMRILDSPGGYERARTTLGYTAMKSICSLYSREESKDECNHIVIDLFGPENMTLSAGRLSNGPTQLVINSSNDVASLTSFDLYNSSEFARSGLSDPVDISSLKYCWNADIPRLLCEMVSDPKRGDYRVGLSTALSSDPGVMITDSSISARSKRPTSSMQLDKITGSSTSSQMHFSISHSAVGKVRYDPGVFKNSGDVFGKSPTTKILRDFLSGWVLAATFERICSRSNQLDYEELSRICQTITNVVSCIKPFVQGSQPRSDDPSELDIDSDIAWSQVLASGAGWMQDLYESESRCFTEMSDETTAKAVAWSLSCLQMGCFVVSNPEVAASCILLTPAGKKEMVCLHDEYNAAMKRADDETSLAIISEKKRESTREALKKVEELLETVKMGLFVDDPEQRSDICSIASNYPHLKGLIGLCTTVPQVQVEEEPQPVIRRKSRRATTRTTNLYSEISRLKEENMRLHMGLLESDQVLQLTGEQQPDVGLDSQRAANNSQPAGRGAPDDERESDDDEEPEEDMGAVLTVTGIVSLKGSPRGKSRWASVMLNGNCVNFKLSKEQVASLQFSKSYDVTLYIYRPVGERLIDIIEHQEAPQPSAIDDVATDNSTSESDGCTHAVLREERDKINAERAAASSCTLPKITVDFLPEPLTEAAPPRLLRPVSSQAREVLNEAPGQPSGVIRSRIVNWADEEEDVQEPCRVTAEQAELSHDDTTFVTTGGLDIEEGDDDDVAPELHNDSESEADIFGEDNFFLSLLGGFDDDLANVDFEEADKGDDVFASADGIHEPQLEEIAESSKSKPLVLSEYAAKRPERLETRAITRSDKVAIDPLDGLPAFGGNQIEISFYQSSIWLRHLGTSHYYEIGTGNFSGLDGLQARSDTTQMYDRFCNIMDSNKINATRLGYSSRCHAFASFVLQQTFNLSGVEGVMASQESNRGDVVLLYGGERYTLDVKGRSAMGMRTKNKQKIFVDKYLLISRCMRTSDTKDLMAFSAAEERYDVRFFINTSIMQPMLEERKDTENKYINKCIEFTDCVRKDVKDNNEGPENLKKLYARYIIEHPPDLSELTKDMDKTLTPKSVASDLSSYIRDNSTHLGEVSIPDLYTVSSSKCSDDFLKWTRDCSWAKVGGVEKKVREIDPRPWGDSAKENSKGHYLLGNEVTAFNKSTYRVIKSPEELEEKMSRQHTVETQNAWRPRSEAETCDKGMALVLTGLHRLKAVDNLFVYSRLLNRVTNGHGSYFDRACSVGICWRPKEIVAKHVQHKDGTKSKSDISTVIDIAFYMEEEPTLCGRWAKCVQNGHEFYLSPTITMGIRDIHYNASLLVRVQTMFMSLVSSERTSVEGAPHVMLTGKILQFMNVACKVSMILRSSTWKTSEYYADSRFITLCSLSGGSGDPLGMVKKMAEVPSEDQQGKKCPIAATNCRLLTYFIICLKKEKRWASKKVSPLLGLPLRHACIEKDLPNGMQWHIRGKLHAQKCSDKMVKLAQYERKSGYVSSIVEHQASEIRFMSRYIEGHTSYEEFASCLKSSEPMYSHVASSSLCLWSKPELSRLPKYKASTKYSLPEMITDHHCPKFEKKGDKTVISGAKVHDELLEVMKTLGMPLDAYTALMRLMRQGEKVRPEDIGYLEPLHRWLFHIHAKDQKGGNRDISQMNAIHRIVQMYIESVIEAVCGVLDADQMTVKTSTKAKTFADIASETLSDMGTLSSKDKSHFCGYMVSSYIGLHILNMSSVVDHYALVSAGSLMMNEFTRRVFLPNETPDSDVKDGEYIEKGYGGSEKDAFYYDAWLNMMQGIFAKSAAAVATIAAIGTKNCLAWIFPFFSHGKTLTTSDDQFDALPGYGLKSSVKYGFELDNYTDRSVQDLFTYHLSSVLRYMMAKENMRKIMVLRMFAEFNNFLVTMSGVVPQEAIQVFQNLQPLDGLSFYEDLRKVSVYARSALMWGNSPDTVMMTLDSAKTMLRAKYKLRKEEHMDVLEQYDFLPSNLSEILVDHSRDNTRFYTELKSMEEARGSRTRESLEVPASTRPASLGDGFWEDDPEEVTTEDDVSEEEVQLLEMQLKRVTRVKNLRVCEEFVHPSYDVRKASRAIIRSRKVESSSVITRFRIQSIANRAESRDGFFNLLSGFMPKRDRANCDVIGSSTRHALRPCDLRPCTMVRSCTATHVEDLQKSYLFSMCRFVSGEFLNPEELDISTRPYTKIKGAQEKKNKKSKSASLKIDCVYGKPRGRGYMTPVTTKVARVFNYSLENTDSSHFEVDRGPKTVKIEGNTHSMSMINIGGKVFKDCTKFIRANKDKKILIPFSLEANQDGTVDYFFQPAGSKMSAIFMVRLPCFSSKTRIMSHDSVHLAIPAREDYSNIPLDKQSVSEVRRYFTNRHCDKTVSLNYGSFCLTSHQIPMRNLAALYKKFDSGFPARVMRVILPNRQWYPPGAMMLEENYYYHMKASDGSRMIVVPQSTVNSGDEKIVLTKLSRVDGIDHVRAIRIDLSDKDLGGKDEDADDEDELEVVEPVL